MSTFKLAEFNNQLNQAIASLEMTPDYATQLKNFISSLLPTGNVEDLKIAVWSGLKGYGTAGGNGKRRIFATFFNRTVRANNPEAMYYWVGDTAQGNISSGEVRDKVQLDGHQSETLLLYNRGRYFENAYKLATSTQPSTITAISSDSGGGLIVYREES